MSNVEHLIGMLLGTEDDWPEQEWTQEIALRSFVPHT